MSDERVWNGRRNASLQHKIRILASYKGDVVEYGMTIPKPIANKFIDCRFIIHTSGNAIILESGCRPFAIEIRKKQMEENKYGEDIMVV